MHSANQPATNQIIDYGIAHAYDFYTLNQLVKSQLKKGFTPYNGLQQFTRADGVMQITQVMVKYAGSGPAVKPAAQKKQPINKHKTKPAK
jgi:hypothetical protein